MVPTPPAREAAAPPPDFDTVPAAAALFRVARKPRVWVWTDLKYAGGGRWDDPKHRYAVLYASSDAFGAYLESLSQFQPDLDLVAHLNQVKRNAKGLNLTRTPGRVPAGWRAQRLLGAAIPTGVTGMFVAISHTTTLSTLRVELAEAIGRLGIDDIDAGVLRLDYSDEFRALTQTVSRLVYERPDGFAGIFYLGQHGDDVQNWAIFQRVADCPVTELSAGEIAADDLDFLRACRLLGLEPA
jgi:hypothetical protein